MPGLSGDARKRLFESLRLVLFREPHGEGTGVFADEDHSDPAGKRSVTVKGVYKLASKAFLPIASGIGGEI